MPTYEDVGFDKFLNRKAPQKVTEYNEDETSVLIPRLSGSSLFSGTSKSADSKMEIDWDKPLITIRDNANVRVYLGKIPGYEDTYGIKVWDADNVSLLDETG